MRTRSERELLHCRARCAYIKSSGLNRCALQISVARQASMSTSLKTSRYNSFPDATLDHHERKSMPALNGSQGSTPQPQRIANH